MSIKMDILSPNKKEMAEILRSTANFIEASSNKTVSVSMTVTFNTSKETKT